MPEITREDVIEILEKSTEAQLRALRALRKAQEKPKRDFSRKSKSNLSIVEDILKDASKPLHINDIISQAQSRFGRKLSRESVVSALTKRVLDQHTFCRTGRNTFALLNPPHKE